MLSADDFATFFREVHGREPFPWQIRLLRRVAETGKWPDVLDLPTGAGKTAAIDIGVFHLALEADRGESRKAPVRIAFVVDRRLVVDDAYARAELLQTALGCPVKPITARVAVCLRRLSGDGPPVLVRRLRGGIPREDDWARTPSQPTVLCSTVDQVGSRLLLRGYGVSDSMKPVHAGLLGSDCLILLDEAHLAEPFRQTLTWVQTYRGPNWREEQHAAPWGFVLLTATPGAEVGDGFSLGDDDCGHPVLAKRLGVAKPARLVEIAKARVKEDDTAGSRTGDGESGGANDLGWRTAAIVDEVRRAIDHFKEESNGAPAPAIGVVVNRVARARAVHERLEAQFAPEIGGAAIGAPVLMIGPGRPVERTEIAEFLKPIRTGEFRALERPLILVATQCVEAGVDLDLDALITEAAPIDALRQRFGRLNRAGRDVVAYAAVVAAKSDLAKNADDPVYGAAIRHTWNYLCERPDGKNGGCPTVDFGLQAFDERMKLHPAPQETVTEKDDAPVLMPAHLDLLSQTSPVPAADPDVALYLHGTSRQSDSVAVVWRADIESGWPDDDRMRRLLTVVSPRAAEAVELPLWTVRRWLEGAKNVAADLADIAARGPSQDDGGGNRRRAFRWKGDDDRSRWIDSRELRPGDTIVVPAGYGGVDRFGWNPGSEATATDVARKAAASFAGRRFAIRVAPGLVGEFVSGDALADTLASAASEHWQDLRAALLDLDLPQEVRDDLEALDRAKGRRRVAAYTDLYGMDGEGRSRGVVFVATSGIAGQEEREEGAPNATEDDTGGSLPGFRQTLAEHSREVEEMAAAFAKSAALPAKRVADLKLAGFLHDAGKADRRFQTWLHYGDPLGPDPEDEKVILAKSDRPLPRAARTSSGLPPNWRHEARSVRFARTHPRLAEAADPGLVLWLVGSHHGYGRPLYPHADATEMPPEVGPQSLAFDWNGLDWPSLFARLKARYGVWELARMEAILRLADHRASERAALRPVVDETE